MVHIYDIPIRRMVATMSFNGGYNEMVATMKGLKIVLLILAFTLSVTGWLAACALAGVAAKMGVEHTLFPVLIGAMIYVLITAAVFLWNARGLLDEINQASEK